MSKELLIDEFREFLLKQRNVDGQAYSPKYISDKLSRLKKLLTVISVKSINNIDEKSFIKLFDKLMVEFDGVYPEKGSRHYHKYNDLLVILRQLYLMKTKKKAPLFIHYGGKIRANKI